MPRTYEWNGKTVVSSILKDPVEGPVKLTGHNLVGDQQSDPEVHGGAWKAVYAYPSEHYEYWMAELPNIDLPNGAFGENLTTSGLLEDEVQVGDVYRFGTMELIASTPRMPCYKLGIRLMRDDIVPRFLASEKPGIYFGVQREGEVSAGDTIELIHKAENSLRIVDLMRLNLGSHDPTLLARAIERQEISEGWREKFHRRLAT